MKVVLIGTDQEMAEGVQRAAQECWPDSANLVTCEFDAGLQVVEREEPDVAILQMSSRPSTVEILHQLLGLPALHVIVVAPSLPDGSPTFMEWATGYPLDSKEME